MLYNTNCFDILQDIKNVDCIIIDPPYNITRAKWDEKIDLEKLWKELKRVRNDNCPIIIFGNEPFSSMVRLSNSKEYRYDFKWIKTNRTTGFLNANYRPLSKYEDIMVFCDKPSGVGGKKSPMRYNPQGIVECFIEKKNTRKRYGKITENNTNCGENNQLNSDKTYEQKYSNYPTNVLEFSCDSNEFHPTQKPVELLEYLIKTYSDKGQTVLDCFMGSGSTGVACVKTNRKFIGIEKEKSYFDIAKKRIKTTQKGLF